MAEDTNAGATRARTACPSNMAHFETPGQRSRNVELNVVPFIDLMSCLTAFLLVTAVWTNMAQVPNAKAGDGGDGDPKARLSVLLAGDALWIGSDGEKRHRIDNRDWEAFESLLANYRDAGGHTSVEIAAEDDIAYEEIVSAMDVSIASGFSQVGVVAPDQLAIRFTR